jgi:transposase
MAAHYNAVVIPARVRKPRDKAKVEEAVQNSERRILAKLRDRTFLGLEGLREAVWEALEDLNNRPFQKMDGCRRSLFLSLDKPALQPLPSTRYEFALWKKARANVDYHVEVDHNYYSVPYQLARQEVEGFFFSLVARSPQEASGEGFVESQENGESCLPRSPSTTLSGVRPMKPLLNA